MLGRAQKHIESSSVSPVGDKGQEVLVNLHGSCCDGWWAQDLGPAQSLESERPGYARHVLRVQPWPCFPHSTTLPRGRTPPYPIVSLSVMMHRKCPGSTWHLVGVQQMITSATVPVHT